ncbi:MAG TPA: PQQ-binding-like beta-propeller repeat protein [Polyangiales bacterium]
MQPLRRWAIAAGLALAGCGAVGGAEDFSRLDQAQLRAAGPGLRVRWATELAPHFGGPYVPVERAAAALDSEHGRLYVGSTQNVLWALRDNGRPLYSYQTESSIEAEPTLDPDHDQLYVTTVRGVVHALHASSGKLRWKFETNAPISRPGVLSEDALYLVTDDDNVLALSRSDGSVLWRYKREPRAGLQISGHAGLLLRHNRLFTGFTDGSIVALSPGDGHVLWLVDTTLDFADPTQTEKGLVDVDTTPVQVGDLIYAASFLGGFYAIDAAHGAVQMRNPELTGITTMTNDEDALVLGSAKSGVVCLELPSLELRWKRSGLRGAPGSVSLRSHTVYVTETRGALLALSLADGREQGRLQTEHGFAASPSLLDGRGFILGNSGTLYAFDY